MVGDLSGMNAEPEEGHKQGCRERFERQPAKPAGNDSIPMTRHGLA
jgi:hypothetical protein